MFVGGACRDGVFMITNISLEIVSKTSNYYYDYYATHLIQILSAILAMMDQTAYALRTGSSFNLAG